MLTATLLLTGCNEKKRAPEFDRSGSALLLEACEAIVNGDEKKAMNSLFSLKQQDAATSFVEEAELAVKRHHDSTEIDNILASGDFQKLKQFLLKAEGDGQLSTGTLIAADMPEALQALLLYKAKMPWEDSASMQMALTALSPYLETLSQSGAFKDFYKEQLALLKSMQTRELDAKVSSCISSLEMAAANGNAAAWAASHTELHRLQPSSPLFKYERTLGKRTKVPVHEARYHAISLLGNWNRLGKKQRDISISDVLSSGGICAGILNAINKGTMTGLEDHAQEMKSLGLHPSPLVIEHFAGILFNKKNAAGDRTNPYGMGLYGLFDFFNSTEITTKTGKKE